MSTDPYGITMFNAPAPSHAVPKCHNAPKTDSAQKKALLYEGLVSTRNSKIAPRYALTVCDRKTPYARTMLMTAQQMIDTCCQESKHAKMGPIVAITPRTAAITEPVFF